jgi:hypothetical protein
MRFTCQTDADETVAYTVHEVETKGDEVTIYLRTDQGQIVTARPEDFEDDPSGEIAKYLEDE